MGGRARGRGERLYVALLRGINVGGRNPLPMKALSEMFQMVGCKEVQTYIQSGNVIFRAANILAGRAPQMVSAEIKERFGFEVPMIIRPAHELRALMSANPFLAHDPKELHMVFLAGAPELSRVAEMDPKRAAPDAFAFCGANIFLHLPNGMARTTLNTSYFDRALETTSTVRNWRTVSKLVELTDEAEEPIAD